MCFQLNKMYRYLIDILKANNFIVAAPQVSFHTHK